MCDENQYYLINECYIEQIRQKIVVLNKAAQFMKNEGFDNFAETVEAYGAEVGSLVNSAIKCDVIPKEVTDDE